MQEHAEKEAALYAKIISIQVADHFDKFSKSLEQSFKNKSRQFYCGQV